MTLLKTQAIQTALVGDWNLAISLNQELLKTNPNDIEALNRLAFALSVLGRVKEAKSIYQKVLSLDTLNPIALRGLKRLYGTSQVKHANSNNNICQPTLKQLSNLFLEETGKTKVIELINIAEPKIIAILRTGEFVNLCIKRLKIFVLRKENQYIGMLPDNIGKRLIKLLKGGNCYEAYIKAVENNHVTIFIKETKRSQRFKNQPSFISTDKSTLVFEKAAHAETSSQKHDTKHADEDGENYSSDDEEDES